MNNMANLGIYLDWTDPEPDEDGVFGRDIAVDGFCEALVRYSPPGRIRFFRNSPVLRSGPQQSSKFTTIAGEGVEPFFSEIRELKADFDAYPFAVWHDLDGNLQLANDLRARYASKLYPITATPHVFSYATLGHSWMLRMLLQQGYPCDSMICPTPTAKTAFLNLAEGICDALGKSHGLNLSWTPRVDVIPLGVDTSLFRPRSKREVRHVLDLPMEATILLWIGRISPLDKADLLPLIRVFSELRQENPDEHLVLVIGGSGHYILERMMEDYVERLQLGETILFRDVPATKRHMFHSAADIFVSPADSIQETFGITPIEAMSCGVPQVVSDWDGYTDGVVHGETGFLIPTFISTFDQDVSKAAGVYDGYDMYDHFLMGQRVVVSPMEMKQSLAELIHNPSLRYRMGQVSRQRAQEKYEWEVVVRSYYDLWDELTHIAQSSRWNARGIVDYEGLSLVKIFGHYATKTIEASQSVFTITAAGQRVARSEEVLPAYYGALGVLDVEILQKLLRALALNKHGFFSLVNRLRSAPLEVERHIMWLVKMGFVSI